MRKYLLGIFVVLSLVLVGCSSEKSNASDEKLQVVQLKGGEAQVSLPEGLTEKEIDGKKMIADSAGDIRVVYFSMPLGVNLGTDKYPIDKFSEKDQKEFIDGMASGFLRQSPAGSTVKSTSIIKLENGHSAGLMELTYGKDEGSASAVAIIYNQEARILVIASKKQDIFEKNKDKFISYFKTFKVKE